MVLFGIWCFALVVQGIFLVIFTRLAFYGDPDSVTEEPLSSVSIIVCAWNELEHLTELIPLLDTQDYPDFEVIIVDDRSTDGSREFLKFDLADYPHVRSLRVEQTPKHISPKKFALTLGIRAAKHETILLTDADCRPVNNAWIRSMAIQTSENKQIVLGFSPYFKKPGLLNAWIRFETFYTALQYLSLALWGLPYMGVGRNLLYRKELFTQRNGFQGFGHILGGDDDLFINRIATAQNTAIAISEASQVSSFPETTFGAWLHQKQRHLSVGRLYKKRTQAVLGLLALSQVLFWVMALALFCVFPEKTRMISGLFLGRILLVWLVWGSVNHRLGKPLTWWKLPLFDALLPMYAVCMGLYAYTRKRRTSWR